MEIRRLKDIREDNDLKQSDIAKILNIPQQNYSRYELGDVSIPIDRLDILATYYNTSIDYLVGRTDVKKPYPKKINNQK